MTSRISSVYYIVQPYFFAHSHLHLRKIDALRNAGIPAWGVAFVTNEMFRKNQERYREFAASGYMKIVRIPSDRDLRFYMLFFLLYHLLFNSNIVVHVLRCDPTAVIWLKRIPSLTRRIRLILEYEGDSPSEMLYRATYDRNPFPLEDPPPDLIMAYQALLSKQLGHVRQADGLVLMSNEHRMLWERRLGKAVNVCILPTLFGLTNARFQQDTRPLIRRTLGLSEKKVFVYVGNVICKWQRFEAMCEFVKRLHETLEDVWLLALVRLDDVDLAKRIAAERGIASYITVISVLPDEVASYLSAADVALFLRHRHTMNLVVTSAKLGEYLAAGLPIITTGANAEILNEFIKSQNMGVFVDDSLDLDQGFWPALMRILQLTVDPAWRISQSESFLAQFGGDDDVLGHYVSFLERIISSSA